MKTGFCFVVSNKITTETLWSSFFKNVDENSYGVYIHAKEPKQFQSQIHYNIVPQHIETKWGTPSLTSASIEVMKHALEDECDQLILLPYDAVPLHDYHTLTGMIKNKNIFCTYPFLKEPQLHVLKTRYNRLSETFKCKITDNMFIKQNMFFTINSSTANQIVDHYVFENIFLQPNTNMLGQFVTDELYFVNMCQYYNIPFQKIPNYIICTSNFTGNIVDNKVTPHLAHTLHNGISGICIGSSPIEDKVNQDDVYVKIIDTPSNFSAKQIPSDSIFCRKVTRLTGQALNYLEDVYAAGCCA